MESGPIILPDGVPMVYTSPLGKLKLAATNIVFGKFPDDLGKEQHGWTAALSMMIGDDRETIKAFKVHVGKSVQYDKFTVNVQRIESSRFGMVVMAEVLAAK
jgi:co-chaperonin GroES (HSP10)